MTAKWRKVVSDLWRARGRVTLVILAIAVGLTGFLAVLSTYAILQRELDRGYLATNPASAVLRMDAIDDGLLASVIARQDVDDADARRVVVGRIQTGPSDWRRLIAFVIRDFEQLRISTVTPEEGQWPPRPGELLIERDAFQVAKARIGDTVTIETPAGQVHTLRVAGRVHDAGQAQARMEDHVYGYISQATLTSIGEPPTLDRLYIIAGGNRFDEAHVRAVAADVKTWLEQGGHTIQRMDVPVPGQHPHSGIMGLLLLAMAAFGLFVLMLSGVIVANLLLTMMAGERRQIGVMKAIGASRGQIARIYLVEAGVLGLVAVVLATPAGLVFGRILCQRFAVLLNFDLASLVVPLWVHLLVLLVGVLVPLVAAAYPVALGTVVTVREALSTIEIDPVAFGSRRLDRLFAGIRSVGRPWLLGVRNSLRRRTRTALTLGTLTTAGTFFVTALSLRRSMEATLDRLFSEGQGYQGISRYAIDQHLLMVYVFLLVVAGVLGAVGGLGLMTATSLNVLDRRRELGVMRAIGASPAMVATIVAIEAVFLACLSWTVAVLAAWPITAGIGRLLTATLFPDGMRVLLAPGAVAGWFAIALALSLVASVGPALNASRRSVREAVSYE